MRIIKIMTMKNKKTPMQEQWEQAKNAHPDAVLFFRMGDFYEMFGDDAVKCSRILGLTLTTRDRNKENAMPMAGIPHHALDRYLKEMMNAGECVAICEQLENPATATGIVKRGVIRVITPGTVLDDSCLTAKKNNYLSAVALVDEQCAIAAVDISTGEFFAYLVNDVEAELARILPSEVILPRELLREGKIFASLPTHLSLLNIVTTKREGYEFTTNSGETRLRNHYGVHNLDGLGISKMPAIIAAAGAILAYLAETQKVALTHLQTLRLLHRDDFLWLDNTTQKNLELFFAPSGYSLISTLDYTLTAGGGRLLKAWLQQPLRTESAITYRQNAVAELMRDNISRGELRNALNKITDFARLLARIAVHRANPRDVFALGVGCAKLPAINEICKNLRAELFRELAFDELREISDLIAAAICENPPLLLSDGGFINSEYHAELTQLRALSNGGKDWLKECERAEQIRSGISSLKIGFNRVFGYYFEITNTHKDKIPADYERKQTLANAERYTTPPLKKYEAQILGAEEKSKTLEAEIFTQICATILQYATRIQQTANILSTIDALASLAEISVVNKYCLPEIGDEITTEIVDGCHPVLATHLHDFTPNNTTFSADAARLHIITGPNMAGKSTYIRQVALLTIMAQMGCGIPATSAKIGLTDRIFTRVGAADDLSRGQSTFMVEMAETANILHNATEKSLIILDEVGRGTSTFDGVSLAWAITEYLHNVIKARTLFATHYHELAELGNLLPHAKNYNVAVREWDERVIFLHKIQAGATDRSYGIQVARLAGLPATVLARAKEVLFNLESSAERRDEEIITTSTNEITPAKNSRRKKIQKTASLF